MIPKEEEIVEDLENLSNDIVNWIRTYAINNNINTLVVGVSGGIDSAVTSTLCSKTELRTINISSFVQELPKSI